MADQGSDSPDSPDSSSRPARLFRGRRRSNSAGGARDFRTVIRHSEEEWVRVQALAAAQGISVPRLYERALTTGGVVASAKLSRIHDELYGVRRLLAIDSNNLNQLARVANTTDRLDAEQELLATIEHLSRVADRITALIEQLPESERTQ
ncbi:hypothetical protein GCM10022376_12890 [Yimella lutea]